MNIARLDHVIRRTNNIEAMVGRYTSVLEFTKRSRPDLSFDGAGLYSNEQAMVQAVEDKNIKPHDKHRTLARIAIVTTGMREFLLRLPAISIPFSGSVNPSFDFPIENNFDCDGNYIHLNFGWDEKSDDEDLQNLENLDIQIVTANSYGYACSEA